MRPVLVLTISCVCFAQIINGASISYVQQRIPVEESLLNTLFYNAQRTVYDRISNTRVAMHKFAEEVKNTMQSGSDSCEHWIKHVEASQSLGTNILYFNICEMSHSPMKDLPLIFERLRENADAAESHCETDLDTCQAEAEEINNYIDLLHESVDNSITAYKEHSYVCVEDKRAEFQRQIEISYDNWRTCT